MIDGEIEMSESECDRETFQGQELKPNYIYVTFVWNPGPQVMYRRNFFIHK